MKNKHIIISSYDDLKNPYFAGGGAHAVHEVAKRLVTKGYHVTVLTGKYPGCKNEIVDNVAYIRTGTSFLGAQLDQLTFQCTLPFFVMTKKFDCWIESFTPPFSTTCLQLFTRKPVVGLVHMLSGEDMKRKYKLPFDLIEKFGIKTYKHIIVTSETIGEKIKRINPKVSISVIPNGIEKIIPTKGKNDYMLFIGRIEVNQKGIDLLLQAYQHLTKDKRLPLYIAGSGEKKELEKLNELIKTLNLGTSIKQLGKVSGVKKEEIYSNAAFVIIPSRFETFSSVALEAMAYGKAIICFDIDGLKWIHQDCAVKIQPFDTEALQAAIETLVNDPNRAQRMGEKGQQFAKQFNWDTIVTKYEHVIKAVI